MSQTLEEGKINPPPVDSENTGRKNKHCLRGSHYLACDEKTILSFLLLLCVDICCQLCCRHESFFQIGREK